MTEYMKMEHSAVRKVSITDACRDYGHRFTADHVPTWAKKPMLHRNGPYKGQTLYYAPQYRSDREWYENTYFEGEYFAASKNACYSMNATWPHGHWLLECYHPLREPKRAEVTKEKAA